MGDLLDLIKLQRFRQAARLDAEKTTPQPAADQAKHNTSAPRPHSPLCSTKFNSLAPCDCQARKE